MNSIDGLSESFSFAEPVFLYLLIFLIPIFFVWLLIVVIQLVFRPEKTYASVYPLIGKIKLWGIFVLPATALMIVALARPNVSGTSIKPTNGDIQVIVLLDNSFSMKADDIKPSRLEIAKKEILNLDLFLKEGDKVGLFTFGKDSDRKLYLTGDFGTFFDQVLEVGSFENLTNETIFGTDFTTALEYIYKSIDRQDAFFEGRKYNQNYNPSKRSSRIVLIFSDGEDQFSIFTPSGTQDNAQRAQERSEFLKRRAEYFKKQTSVFSEYRKRGLKIYPIGIGTRKGVSWLSLLRGYKKGTYPEELDKEWIGQTTRLDRAQLANLAKATGANLSGHDWTVESSQGSIRQYLSYALNSNRKPRLEFAEGDNGQQLWQYCLLAAVGFLIIGIATYPYKGYLRK